MYLASAKYGLENSQYCPVLSKTCSLFLFIRFLKFFLLGTYLAEFYLHSGKKIHCFYSVILTGSRKFKILHEIDTDILYYVIFYCFLACGAVNSGARGRPAGAEEEPPLPHQGADAGGPGDVQVRLLHVEGIVLKQDK